MGWFSKPKKKVTLATRVRRAEARAKKKSQKEALQKRLDKANDYLRK